MLHFESLRHIHQELPNASTEEIVQVVKNRMTKFTDAHIGFNGIANRSAVKFTCIVQDNGYTTELSPHSVPVTHTETGEEDNFNFLFMQSTDDSWELNAKAMTNEQKFVEKHPHCCIIIPPSNSDILLDRLSLGLGSAGGASLPDHYSHPHVSKLFEKKLPGVPKELVCIVKTFDHQAGMRLNQVVHVYGVLEIPYITIEDISESTTLEEILPTIHCVHYELLSPFKLSRPIEESREAILAMSTSIRDQALLSLKSCMLGDELAAEYLYLSLFSKIKRLSGLPTLPGSFGLNFINGSFSSADCALVLDVVKQMKPITAMLPLNIDSLNKQIFMQPSQARFDGEYHGLCRGEFQAPDGSFFLFNECEMTEGTLLERGVRNIKAIQSAINFGLVEYGHEIGSIEHECDFNFIAVGKEASLLSMPFRVKVVEAGQPLNGAALLSEKTGLLIQHLIDIVQNIPFNVSESMVEIIHSSFVNSQKLARENGEPTDDGSLLSKRLQVAENLAKSMGMVELDVECWERAGELERLRLQRLQK